MKYVCAGCNAACCVGNCLLQPVKFLFEFLSLIYSFAFFLRKEKLCYCTGLLQGDSCQTVCIRAVTCCTVQTTVQQILQRPNQVYIMKRKADALQDSSAHDSDSASEDDTSSSDASSASNATSSSSSDSGSDQQQDVDVDFEFFDPQEVDFHGLKALLQTYLDGNAFSCSELVETIIQQVTCRLHRE